MNAARGRRGTESARGQLNCRFWAPDLPLSGAISASRLRPVPIGPAIAAQKTLVHREGPNLLGDSRRDMSATADVGAKILSRVVQSGN
jgi:hypothetical protein